MTISSDSVSLENRTLVSIGSRSQSSLDNTIPYSCTVGTAVVGLGVSKEAVGVSVGAGIAVLAVGIGVEGAALGDARVGIAVMSSVE